MFPPRLLAIFMELVSFSTYVAYVQTNVADVLHISVQIFKIIIDIKLVKALKSVCG